MNNILFFQLLEKNHGLIKRISEKTWMQEANMSTTIKTGKKKGGFSTYFMIKVTDAINDFYGSNYTIQQLFFDKV